MQRISLLLRCPLRRPASFVCRSQPHGLSSLCSSSLGFKSFYIPQRLYLTSRSLLNSPVINRLNDNNNHTNEILTFATEGDSRTLTETIETLLSHRRINEAAFALNNRVIGSEVDNATTKKLLSQCVCHCLWDDTIDVAIYMVRKGHQFDYAELEYALAAMLTTSERSSSFIRMLRFIAAGRRSDLAEAINMTKVFFFMFLSCVFHGSW